jgi:uncharacterized DUF497 family protein
MYIQYSAGGFEWDPDKADLNLVNHGVDFADAAVSLSDPMAVTVEDPDAEGEERFISLALSPVGVVLVTVYTYVGENIRLISSRKASPGECRAYEAK